MKKILFLSLLITLFSSVNSQTIVTSPDNYQLLKSSGNLNKKAKYVFTRPTSLTVNTNSQHKLQNISSQGLKSVASSANNSCNCLVPVDNTFTVVPMTNSFPPTYDNDDDSSPLIALGFNFCFYGAIYNSCYINNNGNITFNNDLAGYSAGGFPAGDPLDQDTVIIAPFWADVDTRGFGSGLVYYKKTPTALIVKWNNVGYYSSQDDLLNDFQLVITNGNDPLLPNGNNVAFCYGDMQWTTGSASDGINGFGGTAATAGVNKGDQTNYIQIGRFDQPGISYDGPYGVNDEISFLDNKSYYFNTCGTNNNLPPIVQDATGGGSVCGDTIKICALGDTLVYSTSFLAPENNQTVTIVGNAPSLGANFQPLGVTTSTAGTTTFAWRVIATPTLAGVHTVIVTGTDNGSPALSSSATYYIKIENIVIPAPILSSSPVGSVCATPGATITLTNCSSYDNVYWSNGASGCSIIASATGAYYVTVNKQGCYKSSVDSVNVLPNPIPVITGPLVYCPPATSTTLSVNPPLAGMTAYASYNWSPNGILTPTAALNGGQKTLSVTDVNGCIGSVSFFISPNTPVINITANPTSICGAGTTTLTANMLGASSYTWVGGPLAQTNTVTTAGVYTVSGTSNDCIATNTINIVFNPTPTVTIPNSVGLCAGSNATVSVISISPNGVYTYTWSNGSNSPNLVSGTSSTVTLQVKNITTGCVSVTSNSCTIVAASNPTVSFANSLVSFCNGSFATLSPSVTGGSPAYTYSWAPASLGTSATATTTSNNGVFTVRVKDANQCIGSKTVSVVKSTPAVTISAPDKFICPGECVKAKAIGASNFLPGTYSWANNPSNTTDSLIICIASVATASYTDAKGCVATATTQIIDDVVPVASFSATPESPVVPDQVIDFTNTSTMASGNIVNSVWLFGDGAGAFGNTVNYGYPSAGVFPVTLIVTGSNGCKDTVSLDYVVEAIISAPNVITPNGDKANDLLKFKNLEFYSKNDLIILNRWGKKIYEQSNYKNDWDGSSFSDGTYFYILNVPEAKIKAYNGFFQLIH